MGERFVFRDHHPIRTYDIEHSNYKSYKPYLRNDFQYRCGYCNAKDIFLGGASIYHVDHFAPKSKFPELLLKYSNLVYACPYCNRSKSNDWLSDTSSIHIVEEKGYIDPCDEAYISHLCRDQDGNIIPLTNVGLYMYKKMNFGLPRHKVLWRIAKLKEIIDEMNNMIDEDPSLLDNIDLVEKVRIENKEFQKYFDYITGTK